MKKMRTLPTRTKAFLLLISGLVIGVWQGYGIAIGSNFVIPQPKLMFDLMFLLTSTWMVIWTIRKRRVRVRERYAGIPDINWLSISFLIFTIIYIVFLAANGPIDYPYNNLF